MELLICFKGTSKQKGENFEKTFGGWGSACRGDAFLPRSRPTESRKPHFFNRGFGLRTRQPLQATRFEIILKVTQRRPKSFAFLFIFGLLRVWTLTFFFCPVGLLLFSSLGALVVVAALVVAVVVVSQGKQRMIESTKSTEVQTCELTRSSCLEAAAIRSEGRFEGWIKVLGLGHSKKRTGGRYNKQCPPGFWEGLCEFLGFYFCLIPLCGRLNPTPNPVIPKSTVHKLSQIVLELPPLPCHMSQEPSRKNCSDAGGRVWGWFSRLCFKPRQDCIFQCVVLSSRCFSSTVALNISHKTESCENSQRNPILNVSVSDVPLGGLLTLQRVKSATVQQWLWYISGNNLLQLQSSKTTIAGLFSVCNFLHHK